jgi:hypothetical protein
MGLEGWTLLWLGGVQGLVGYFWWRGPALPQTRVAVAVLFGVNAAATTLVALGDLGGWPSAGSAASVLDRFTNPLLLAATLAALAPAGRLRLAAGAAVGASFLGIAVALALQPPPPWNGPLIEGSLLMAMPVAAAGLLRQLREPPSPLRSAWVLVLAVLSMRFADLSISIFVPGLESADVGPLHQGLRMLGLVAMLAVAGMLLRATLGAQARDASLIGAALALVLAGFLLGASRVGLGEVTAIAFSLALVRPAVLVAAQGVLRGARPGQSPEERGLVVFVALMVVSMLGFVVGDMAWGLPTGAAALLATAFPLLAYPLVVRLLPPRPAGDTAATDVASERERRRAWRLDERVPLPMDWERRLQDARVAHRALGAAARARLALATRWQRILLALQAVPPDAAKAYERTTPGLHLATQVPYAAIGPEIARCNARWESILREQGLPRPTLPVDPRQSLVRGTWGRADGLRSERVRVYHLTPLGQQVAAQLREQMGLGAVPSGLAAKVAGEALPTPASDSEVVRR